jgi:DNA-binding beta-propeller fold protein YncE
LTDDAAVLAVSPNGATVYVTGGSYGSGTGYDYATVAYDASTGAKVWAQRYDGLGSAYDQAFGLAVSRDGAKVYVTGGSTSGTTGEDYATIAYEA